MKSLLFLFVFLSVLTGSAQQQTFDIITYTQPTGWAKESSQSAVQLSHENKTDGSYCLITVFKSVPGTASSRENFDAAWETVVKEMVKEMVKVSGKPEMQSPSKEDGWEAISGYSPFESDGQKGIALLVTSTGFDKMVNILVLTNTNTYESELSAFLESISLSKPPAGKSNSGNTGPVIGNAIQTQPSQQTKAISSGFAFNTTNFDDGWTSTVQEDWVEVTKGNFKVLLHYPKQGTIFPADPEPLTNAAWNILVAPRYSNLKNYRTTSITTYNRPYLGFGTATDNKSGKEVYIVFFRQGNSGWLEFITPDKNSFTQHFSFDPEIIRWDSNSDLMEPLLKMVSYNKFAVAASDFKGTWTSDFSGMQQLYHVYTGEYAGMNINQSSQTFQFGAGNSYNWKIIAVNGQTGNMRYGHAKSSGRFSVPNNWQVKFSDIEGKPVLYHAYFSCIKGTRILNILNAQYPGSGIYTSFGLQK